VQNFAHIELNTSDPDKVLSFYQSLFGWKFDKMLMPGGVEYFMVRDAEEPSIGLMHKAMPEAPDCWLGYVAVGSAPAAVTKARELGAQVLVEGIVVPGVGEWAVLMDPTGAVFGVWAPEAPPPAVKKAKKAKPAKKAKKVAKKKVARKAKKAKKAKPAKKAKKVAKKKVARKAKKAPKRAARKGRKARRR
jgi:hypothetical protein